MELQRKLQDEIKIQNLQVVLKEVQISNESIRMEIQEKLDLIYQLGI